MFARRTKFFVIPVSVSSSFGVVLDLQLRWEDPCRKGLQEALRGFASAEEAKVP